MTENETPEGVVSVRYNEGGLDLLFCAYFRGAQGMSSESILSFIAQCSHNFYLKVAEAQTNLKRS